MKRLTILSAILMLCFTSNAPAQDSVKKFGAYFYMGKNTANDPSRYTNSRDIDAGFGVEYVPLKGFGFGTELGGLGPNYILFSLDGIYRLPHSGKLAKSKLYPFVTLGYSAIADDDGDTGSGFNFGGGVNYRLKKRLAIRVEFRDHVFSNPAQGSFPSFRFGLTSF